MKKNGGHALRKCTKFAQIATSRFAEHSAGSLHDLCKLCAFPEGMPSVFLHLRGAGRAIRWYSFAARGLAGRTFNDESVLNFRTRFQASAWFFRAAGAAKALVAWQRDGSRTACRRQDPSGLYHSDDNRGPSIQEGFSRPRRRRPSVSLYSSPHSRRAATGPVVRWHPAIAGVWRHFGVASLVSGGSA